MPMVGGKEFPYGKNGFAANFNFKYLFIII